MNLIRRKSEKYLFYEALERRLPNSHYYLDAIQQNLRKESGGYAGELRVDRELQETRHFEEYKVLRNLFVGSNQSYCQIDTLVIHPHFIVIIEVKNIPGFLTYVEETHQLTRQRENGPVEGMGDPKSQVKRSERFVRDFLTNYKLSIPVHGMIVLSNPSSILAQPIKECLALHVSGLYETMENLHRLYADHQKSPRFDTRKIHRLFQQHEPIMPPYRPTHIPTTIYKGIQTGVICSNCGKNKLDYKSKTWRCSHCKFKSENTHLQTLQEFSILFSQEITTVEWMNFSGLKSMATTRRVLNESNLGKTGGNKNRKWIIPRVSKSQLGGETCLIDKNVILIDKSPV